MEPLEKTNSNVENEEKKKKITFVVVEQKLQSKRTKNSKI